MLQEGEYQARPKLTSLLTLALEELPDVPLYYNLHDLAKLLKTQAPPQDTFRSALVNAGTFPHPSPTPYLNSRLSIPNLRLIQKKSSALIRCAV